MIYITSIAFSPVDFADNPVAYLNGCVADKYKAVINFYMWKGTTNQKRLRFSGNTITNINALDSESWISDIGLVVGETFVIPASVHNSGTLTITALTDTTIGVSTTLTAETLEVGYLYVNSALTCIDFFYNLISNSAQPTFLSKTDPTTLQKYTISGLDASDTSTVHNLLVGTKSFAWLADSITGVNTTSSTIVGAGITSYKQAFTLTHYFDQDPIFLAEYYTNFKTNTPPADYSDAEMNGVPINNGLQYICQINGKYAVGAAYQNTGNSTQALGNAAWFNQNNARTTPEFTFNSITYTNASTSAVMPALDAGQNVNVVIKIKSASGLFSIVEGLGTKLVLRHFYCPLDPSTYQNNPNNLIQNFFIDKASPRLGGATVNGSSFGTTYQVLASVSAVMVDAYNATISFTVSYGSLVKSTLLAKAATDRNYLFSITTETTTD